MAGRNNVIQEREGSNIGGTLSGGRAAAKTNKAKYDEHYLKATGMTFYQYLGHIGGKKSRGGGVTGNPKRASEIGKIGGLRGRKGYRFIGEIAGDLKYIDKVTGEVVIFKEDGTLEKDKRSSKVQDIQHG